MDSHNHIQPGKPDDHDAVSNDLAPHDYQAPDDGCRTDTTHDYQAPDDGCRTDTTRDYQAPDHGCRTDTTHDYQAPDHDCRTDTTHDYQAPDHGCRTDTMLLPRCGCCGRSVTDIKDMKILPCLHIVCEQCVNDHTRQESHSSHTQTTELLRTEPAACTFLCVCPLCGFKVISSSNHVTKIHDYLKDVPRFLQEGDQNNGIGMASVMSKNVEDKESDVAVLECQACGCGVSPSVSEVYCQECGHIVCCQCKQSKDHDNHSIVSLEVCAKSKRQYISSLNDDMKKKVTKHEETISCVDRIKAYLSTVKKEIETEINLRSKYLIKLIEERKANLMSKLEEYIQRNTVNYDRMNETFTAELDRFHFVSDFMEKLIAKGTNTDILSYHENVSNIGLHQIHQIPEAKVDVASLKLDVPGKGKEHLALEKLFGSLTEGTVLSGTKELVASFNVDMKWPTSIGVSSSKEIVITGKCGAFDAPGKAYFFDSRGRMHSKLDYDSKHVPLDVKSAGDGTVWMSNNQGQLLNMTAAGRVLRTVHDVFHGSGQIAVLSHGALAVVSSVERKVNVLNEIGQFQKSINVPGQERNHCKMRNELKNGVRLTAITTNSNDDIILGDTEGRRILVIDTDGHVKCAYPEVALSDSHGQQPVLKCPSAICCDHFDNILVADFTSDCVSLFSMSGQFLGQVLTKDDGISCPNCMALDHEGKLYIGQYGGDVLVFRYMSCNKTA